MISVLCACQRGRSSSPDRYILANLSTTALCQQYCTGTIRFCNSLQTQNVDESERCKLQSSLVLAISAVEDICTRPAVAELCFDWTAGPLKCLYQHGSLLTLCLKVMSGCRKPSNRPGGRSDNCFNQVYYLFSAYHFSRKNHSFCPPGLLWPPQTPHKRQKFRRGSQHIPGTPETFT